MHSGKLGGMYVARIRRMDRIPFEARFETLDQVHAHLAELEAAHPGYTSDDYSVSVPRGEDLILMTGSLRATETAEITGEVYDFDEIRAAVPEGWQLQSVRPA